MNIDFDKLREDLIDYFGTAMGGPYRRVFDNKIFTDFLY